jgi:acyl-lipid omega-6 desaturase (Delta-12 desaturase)
MSAISELRRPLAELRVQPAVWAASLSAFGFGLYGGLFYGAAFGASSWPRLVCMLGLGPAIAFLFRIAHDTGHLCHLRGMRANHLLGRISILPSYHPYSVWMVLHNARHHAFTNLRGVDYIWTPLSKPEYDGLGKFGRWRERMYRSAFGTGAYYLYAIWWRQMMLGRHVIRARRPGTFLIDQCMVLVFVTLQLGVLAMVGGGAGGFALRVLGCMVVPHVTLTWMLGYVSFFNHTHPLVPWFARREEWSFHVGQVHCTVHMRVPAWLVFFMTDLGLHGAHHIDPRIPIWRLDEAERRLLAAEPALREEKWTWRTQRDILRRCKLYDYDAHCWLDFAGNRTAAPIALAG